MKCTIDQLSLMLQFLLSCDMRYVLHSQGSQLHKRLGIQMLKETSHSSKKVNANSK
jgi:hypothetical protein